MQKRITLSIAFMGFCLVFLAFTAKAADYEILDRYKTIEDKTLTDEIFRPLKHDFILNINAKATDGISGFISDVSDATDVSGTDAEKITQVSSILNKVNDEEHFFNVSLLAGIPLPKFNAFGLGIVPDLRASYDLGGMLAITNRGNELPALLQLISGVTSDVYAFMYLKQDTKIGANLGINFGKNWFSETYLHYLSRWDRIEAVSATEVVQDENVINLDEQKNTATYANVDLKFGHKSEDEKWKTFFSIEDLELARLSVTESASEGPVHYQHDPLFRLHGQYSFDLTLFKITPFAGVHWRDGYDLSDGVYGGAELFLLSGWVPLSAVAMIDNYFYTLHPRLRLWFFELEYAGKIPIKSTENGFKTAAVHHLNVRFSF